MLTNTTLPPFIESFVSVAITAVFSETTKLIEPKSLGTLQLGMSKNRGCRVKRVAVSLITT